MVKDSDFDIPISPLRHIWLIVVGQSFGTGSKARHTNSIDLLRYINPFWSKSKINSELNALSGVPFHGVPIRRVFPERPAAHPLAMRQQTAAAVSRSCALHSRVSTPNLRSEICLVRRSSRPRRSIWFLGYSIQFHFPVFCNAWIFRFANCRFSGDILSRNTIPSQ